MDFRVGTSHRLSPAIPSTLDPEVPFFVLHQLHWSNISYFIKLSTHRPTQLFFVYILYRSNNYRTVVHRWREREREIDRERETVKKKSEITTPSWILGQRLKPSHLRWPKITQHLPGSSVHVPHDQLFHNNCKPTAHKILYTLTKKQYRNILYYIYISYLYFSWTRSRCYSRDHMKIW